MNDHIMAWLVALRSGKYNQARGFLRNTDSFCCVGVECDVFDPTKWKMDEFEGASYQSNKHDYFSAEVPPEVRAASGFRENFYMVLYKMNDEKNKTFAEIADFIEESIINGVAYQDHPSFVLDEK